MTRKKNRSQRREEKTYDIPDIDARLAAMKCEHVYTHGHEVGCDNCHYIPYEEDDTSSCDALHHNQPVDDRRSPGTSGAVDTSSHTNDIFNNPTLPGVDFNEFIENMHLQKAIDQTTYEHLKKQSPSLRRDKILVDLKERYTKGKLSEKKYTQMVLATYMQY